MELMDTGQLFHVDTMHESELNVFMTNYMYSAVDGFLLVSELTLVFFALFLCLFFLFLFFVFTALLGIQTQSSDENSVNLSVGLSICQTR